MPDHVLSPTAYAELIEPLPPNLRDRLASHDKALRQLVAELGYERTRHRERAAELTVRADNAERAQRIARQDRESAMRDFSVAARQIEYLYGELESARDQLDLLREEAV